MVAACKRTKDTFTSRTFHRTVSHFNPLFNGEQALLKGERTLSILHEDDFSKVLPVFRTGTKAQASNVKPDMDKAVEKGTKVITEHSMMIRNVQKNKWVDDSYLLIGKARFYKREYLEALETFNYVIQEFPKSDIYEEARLWAARTETALGNFITAKDKFEQIYRSEKLPRKLKGDAFAAYAQLEIDQRRYTPAYQLLEQAANKTRDKEKEVRWLFIMGQLQAITGNDQEASETFLKVIKKGPPYELLFQAQLNRARTYDVILNDPAVVFKDLNKMLKDDKNYDNRDQIYYVMAEVSEKLDDEGKVEEYLKKSIRTSTTNAGQKALSYLKLGEINFDNRVYPTAAAYYDSSFTNLPNTHPRYKEIQRKKESLAELVTNLNIISLQDSLQVLANYSEKKRFEKIDGIIAAKKAKEEAEREREQDPFNQVPGDGQSFAQGSQSSIQGGSWYFYNQRLRAAGITEFTTKFGNRKLEDNWRRSDKELTGDFNDNGEGSQNDGNDGGEQVASKSQQEEREEYLKEIPLTEEALQASHGKIVNAYLRVGAIYKEDFKDYTSAEDELKDLLKRYPELDLKPRVWYMLYRINVLASDTKDAEYYKSLIKSQYPDSEYAALVDGEQPKTEQDASRSLAYYKKTFLRYEQADYKKSLTMADSGLVAFNSTDQGSRFMMVKAFSQGKLGQSSKMSETLNSVVTKYPGTEQAQKAQDILNRLAAPAVSPSKKGERASAGNSAEAKQTPENKKYAANPTEEHKYLLALPNIKGMVNNITIDLSDFNKKFFKNIQLNTKAIYISTEKQMILVSGLPNEKTAYQYFEVLDQQNVLDKNLAGQSFQHFVISNSNFAKFYQDKDFEGYEKYFKDNYKKSE